jgi:uncharacterized protein (DUF302 family)
MKTTLLLSLLLPGLLSGSALAQGGPNHPDMQTIHKIFAQTNSITRTAKNIPGGIETLTESSDPKVVALLQEHVAAMKRRLQTGQPIRKWDPLFAVLFEHADRVQMSVTNTRRGVRVTETSADPYVVKLLQEHAKAVSGFVKDGMAGMHKSHPAPPRTAPSAPAPKEPTFIGKGDGQTTCPVTGEPVDPAVSTLWKGQKVLFCCASCKGAFAKVPERYLRPGHDDTRTVERPFTEVLEAVQAAAKAQGFNVLGTHDLAASLKKAGIEREPYVVVEVCHPEQAAAVLKIEPRMGSQLPCRIAVWQAGPKTLVSTLRPTALVGLLPDAPLAAPARQVDAALKAILDAATR